MKAIDQEYVRSEIMYEAGPQSYSNPSHIMGGAEHDGGGGSEADKRTLWVGDIDQWMDENYISALFGSAAEVANVKIIRDKMTGLPAGYGFVEFNSHEGAARVLNDFNNVPIPGVGRSFRLNWATFGIAARHVILHKPP